MLRSAGEYGTNSILDFSKKRTYSPKYQLQLFTLSSSVNKGSLILFGDICFLDDVLSYWREIESHGSFCFDCPGVLDVEYF